MFNSPTMFNTATARVTYTMNQWINQDMFKGGNENDFPHPSSSFLLVDQSADNLNDGNYNPSNQADIFGDQHFIGGNVIHMDGHVKTYPFKDLSFNGAMHRRFDPRRVVD